MRNGRKKKRKEKKNVSIITPIKTYLTLVISLPCDVLLARRWSSSDVVPIQQPKELLHNSVYCTRI